jgi:hypothetical protein
VVTAPREFGITVAFLAEVGITFVLMMTILFVSNTPRLARYTGLCAGTLVFLYITFEDPLSGMSMNPARSFASAFISENWTGWWVYFVAPPLGMLAAAQTYLWLRGSAAVHCAKMHHQNSKRCIFCAYQQARAKEDRTPSSRMARTSAVSRQRPPQRTAPGVTPAPSSPSRRQTQSTASDAPPKERGSSA